VAGTADEISPYRKRVARRGGGRLRHAFHSGHTGNRDLAQRLPRIAGARQLRTDGTLPALASEHAADMARRDSLDHDGFMTQRGPRGARAENVAYGCKESACVIQQWVNSFGHRKNILIPSLTRYGLASATSPSGKKYWALLVGE
jgi:uncharacterized protein YkwD